MDVLYSGTFSLSIPPKTPHFQNFFDLFENEVFISKIDYGKATSDNGISDYNNSSHINITRDGFSVPTDAEWFGAFGLMVTLVWLYFEILSLFYYHFFQAF